ncbi:MAG: thioredoxin domain-containing protein [Chitinophagaceae bacterium]
MSTLKLPVDANRDRILGSPGASVELVQYGDFQCEHCAAVYAHIKFLQESLGKQLRFVFRHYPLVVLHPLSLDAAVASEAAGLQGKFWQMHDLIFENQKYLTKSIFSSFAREIDMDTTMLDNISARKKLVYKVINDFESGVKSGVNGTPTFFVNGRRYSGFEDFEGLYRTCNYAIGINRMLV